MNKNEKEQKNQEKEKKRPSYPPTTREKAYSGALFFPLVAHYGCATKDKPLIRA